MWADQRFLPLSNLTTRVMLSCLAAKLLFSEFGGVPLDGPSAALARKQTFRRQLDVTELEFK